MNRIISLFVLVVLLGTWRFGQAETITVWVEREDLHTAVLIPTAAARHMPGVAKLLNQPDQTQGLVRFGWGDRDYYGAERQTPAMAAKALLLPTRSVVEVSVHSADAAPRNSIAIQLTTEELEKLKTFIYRSFRKDSSGQPRFVRRNRDERYYYAGKGRYHLLSNCNHWTARALQRSGIKIKRKPLMLAKTLIRQIEAEGRAPDSIAAFIPSTP